MAKKLIVITTVALLVLTLAGCSPRPNIQTNYGPRLDAVESRLAALENALDSLSTQVYKANTNDEILNTNMENLYKEVDELRTKMGMPLSKPRRTLVK